MARHEMSQRTVTLSLDESNWHGIPAGPPRRLRFPSSFVPKPRVRKTFPARRSWCFWIPAYFLPLLPKSDDHDRSGPEILLDPWSATTLSPTPFQLTRLDCLPALPSPAVQEGLDLCVRGEVPRQVVVEAKLTPRHDEQVTRQDEISTRGRTRNVRGSDQDPSPYPWESWEPFDRAGAAF